MGKKYKGSLSLEWFNKQKSIINLDKNSVKGKDDIPAPRINWINKEDALFYEISEEDGKGNKPYWVNRDDIRVKEARPLIFQKAYKAVKKDKKGALPGTESVFGIEEILDEEKTNDIDNILIKGDNLLALNTLKKYFDKLPDEEKVKCIYIDPPYNTGSAFEHYDDNLAHSEWLTLMRDRLLILRSLLSSKGSIFVHIDDREGHYLKVLLDEIFGRKNYLTTFYTKVRYADKTLKQDMDFHKEIEQIHIYRKEYGAKPNLDTKEKTFEKFIYEITEKEKGKEIKLGGKKIEIFSKNQYQIKKKEKGDEYGLKEIWASGTILDGNSSGRFFRDYFTGRYEEDGYNILYKVYGIGNDRYDYRYFTGPKREGATKGKYYQGVPINDISSEKKHKTIPINNFYDLAADFGNCRTEGGVPFRSGKKPEKLLNILINYFSNKGDWVLDVFGGSGTTFATTHKMNRKWIGVEIGNHADTHIIPRLMNVLKGSDKSGISKTVNWQGGGSFKYYHLGESIISIDEETKKGEFNWSLGKQFIQESLLISYDFIIQDINIFPQQIISDENNKPTIGKLLGISGKSIYGISYLVGPKEDNITISNEEIKNIYNNLKKQPDFQSLVIYTNKGIDISQDTIPDDLEIIKVPHAIFSELER